MGRRQPGVDHARDHLQRGHDAAARVREVEHHPVAEPLHRPAAVLDRRPLDEPAELLGQLGRRRVAPLLGEPRVAGDVEEAHRGGMLEAAVQAGGGQQRLEPSMMLSVQACACCRWYMPMMARSVRTLI